MKKNTSYFSQKALYLLILVFLVKFGNSQGVAINTDGSRANSSAMLDVKSTTSGMLIPRMTQAERNGISSPASSLLIYQTDNTPGFYYWDSRSWVQLFSGDEVDPSWDGDADTTSDIYRAGKVGIGTINPAVELEVSGNIMTFDGLLTSAISYVRPFPRPDL